MPKREDIKSVLILGSGPIVIGQACEFDYSGVQACKALRQEGLRVILINSNPATIMTDPDIADATYIEPLTLEVVDKVLAQQKPDAVLPTLGGQTALNLAVAAHKAGILEKHGTKLIGAQIDAIEKAEDRNLFRLAMAKIGLKTPHSVYVGSLEEARKCRDEIGFPAILRPSFTLGGSGAAIAYNARDYEGLVQWGLDQSPRREILIEQSVLGWKEYELEVMRDHKDNVVIVCSIENFDPMGIHTGDSITVAPALTLTDREYQRMRDAALAVIREIGVETGGSNIQFAVNPENGEQIVIEMNPRVSRSSALASKATGFPIAKLAAKLAIGYSLDELKNDITRVTPASFEPTIDYVVVKIPRFAFEKFPGATPILGTQMKSVGEVMAVGRTFNEAMGKAVRALDIGRHGFDMKMPAVVEQDPDELRRRLSIFGVTRLYEMAEALRRGFSTDEVCRLTKVDPWFVRQLAQVIFAESEIAKIGSLQGLASRWRDIKQMGFSDERIAALLGVSATEVRAARKSHGVVPVFKTVDTCAAEFAAHTPYFYSTYEQDCEANPTSKPKIMILGSGPNRIGQGIEFDYCCVHAAMAVRALGYEAIMLNCNPETVSTDYDTSDRLYFEPITLEDVLEVYEKEKPQGLIVQFGGQTPLKLALPLAKLGVPLIGTSAEAIDRAEDRERFGELMEKLNLQCPRWGIGRTADATLEVAAQIGYPVMVRPSYVLGGRAMERVYHPAGLQDYFVRTQDIGWPLLVDQFLSDAIELDIDVLADKNGEVWVAGIMEHIEEAGIHSGDSACVLPPHTLPRAVLDELKRQAIAIAKELEVVGLMNMQAAVLDNEIYILEVNPRASRTVPFVSKAIGLPLAKIATQLMLGKTLAETDAKDVAIPHVAVKESVFPFAKFDNVDPILGPEMRSTGEVMGLDASFAGAFLKAQIAAGNPLPQRGCAFLSVKNSDKVKLTHVARDLVKLGFTLLATRGTAEFLLGEKIAVTPINKVMEGHPHCVDAIENGGVALVINTTEGAQAVIDSASLRRTALLRNIPYVTTLRAAQAAVLAISAAKRGQMQVRALQDYHPRTV